MLARFFQQIVNSCGVVFRTFRAFFTRQFMGLRARIRRITSFSRQAARLVPKAMSSLAVAGQKPTVREDFIETKRLFVAKSFLVTLAVGAVVLGLLAYFVVWPWMLSRFFTAHFYQGDSDLSDYTGKVVLYYDEGRELPHLEGEMSEGIFRGEGREYDENGLLIYSGGFSGGLYEGTGSLYEEGVLRYKGEFSGGLYSGQGVTYHPSGGQEYVGAFSQGLYEGEGTLYYENGQLCYKGQFSAGSFDGEGRLYREDGNLLYEGAFQEGLYNGEGRLRTDEELQLAGQFENGEPLGEVSIYRSGKLSYQGEVKDLLPDGMGTLYSSTGTAVYTGAMSQGTPDFSAMLDLTGDDIRAVFGEASLTETAGESGFSIRNETLGVTLFCSYKTEESDPQVYDVYCYNDEADSFARVMPWNSEEEFEARFQGYEKQEAEQVTEFLGNVPFEDGTYHCVTYIFDTYTVQGWSDSEDSDWFMVQWSANRALPLMTDEEGAQPEEQEEADRLESLLQSLGVGGEVSASTLSATQGISSSSDRQDAADLAQDFQPVMDYYLQAETLAELEEQLSLKKALLEAQQEKDRMGSADEELLSELESQVPGLEIQAGKAQVALERLKLDHAGIENMDCGTAVQALLQPPSEFGAAALDAAGGSREAELALIDLELSWQAAQQAKTAYESAAQSAEQAQTDYRTGISDEQAQCDALCARSEAAVQLHEAVYDYAMQALEFNTMADGYLSEGYQWAQALKG